jgi:hypothetical protein
MTLPQWAREVIEAGAPPAGADKRAAHEHAVARLERHWRDELEPDLWRASFDLPREVAGAGNLLRLMLHIAVWRPPDQRQALMDMNRLDEKAGKDAHALAQLLRHRLALEAERGVLSAADVDLFSLLREVCMRPEYAAWAAATRAEDFFRRALNTSNEGPCLPEVLETAAEQLDSRAVPHSVDNLDLATASQKDASDALNVVLLLIQRFQRLRLLGSKPLSDSAIATIVNVTLDLDAKYGRENVKTARAALRKALGRELDRATTDITKLAERGMPTDSVQAAEAWLYDTSSFDVLDDLSRLAGELLLGSRHAD